jgi:hypothetical protein
MWFWLGVAAAAEPSCQATAKGEASRLVALAAEIADAGDGQDAADQVRSLITQASAYPDDGFGVRDAVLTLGEARLDQIQEGEPADVDPELASVERAKAAHDAACGSVQPRIPQML